MNKLSSGRTSRRGTIAWSICRSEERRGRWLGSGSPAKGIWGAWWSSGCGTGFYTEVLAPNADTLLPTDIPPGMLDVAKQRVNAPNVIFRAEDCQRTSLPDGAFDTAFISLVVHFTVPDHTLAEMYRILRPGGTLIIVKMLDRGLESEENPSPYEF